MEYLLTALVVFLCLTAAFVTLQVSWLASAGLVCFATWSVHKQANGWR